MKHLSQGTHCAPIAAGLALSLMAGIAHPARPALADTGTITIRQNHNQGATYDAYLLFKAHVASDDKATGVVWASDEMKAAVLGFIDANGYKEWLSDRHPGAEMHDRAQIAAEFVEGGDEILGGEGSIVLFVGVNGSGKTTTTGKIAKQAKDAGRTVILGCGDTFRAAAIEQLEVWAQRAGVEICARERGSDPASVCYETIERGEAIGADLVLIDTAGRLHTSADLMRELEKVVTVVRKRANLPVHLVLVIDATTGQNGLQQAREFNSALDLDGVIITKLDGTAKGGIAVAVAHYLKLPIVKLGVGEGLEDLKDFDAHEYAAGPLGDFGQE